MVNDNNNNPEVMGLEELPEANLAPYAKDNAEVMGQYQTVYPEIYYKLQPYINVICDQMDFYQTEPTLEMVQQITDNIYDDVARTYPDLAEYANNNDNPGHNPTSGNPHGNPNGNPIRRNPYDRYGRYTPYRFDGGYRRRGLFRDIIDIMLLSELSRRRRRYFY